MTNTAIEDSPAMNDHIGQSLQLVQDWVEKNNYKGYDPGDGLTSFLRPLTFGKIFPERLLQQLIWKSPFNIRPFVGVKPMDSTKGRGFMAWGYMMLFGATEQVTYRDKAASCLDWLDQNKENGWTGHCWGNHFDFTTRGGRMVAHTPTIVWSGLIGQAFLEAFERTQDEKYLDVSKSICEWILSIPRERTDSGDCLSYVPTGQSSVHNSNLLGAGMLTRTWNHCQKDEYIEAARKAVEYSCSRQLDDGAWWYGEAEMHHWIDNFHTAYNIDSIKRYIDYSGDKSFQVNLDSGYRYFKEVFFEDSGLPRYYHNRKNPIDIQCASQAIDTFAHFSDVDPEALQMAEKVANWTIENMQDKTGYFHYRKYPLMNAKTPYFHWGQATMFKALSHLFLKRDS